MLNSISLVGRMTRDPELRYTPSGSGVANFTLAVNRDFRSENGQDCDFIRCEVWGKTAEAVGQYCQKGSLVSVNGQLQSRSFDGKDGQRVNTFVVRCSTVNFLDTKKAMEQERDARAERQAEAKYRETLDQYQKIQKRQQEQREKEMDIYSITDDDIQF